MARTTRMNRTAEGGKKDSPYFRFCNDELILRDELAVDRTLLANERTLLESLWVAGKDLGRAYRIDSKVTAYARGGRVHPH